MLPMLYNYGTLSQLSYDQLLEIAQSILICELPQTTSEIVNKIFDHQQAFGASEVVNAASLEIGDFILIEISVPSFSNQVRMGWSKILRCYCVDTTEDDVINFFDGYGNVFISNQSHVELLDKITNKMVYIEAISSLAVGNKTINCQTIVRAKVLPSFKFVRKVE